MNLILFEPGELGAPLPKSDPRAVHILTVLRRQPGESFDVGQINGPRGKGVVTAQTSDALTLTFTWGVEPPPLDGITLLIGMPRPQTARDILRDVTTLGVKALHFVQTEKSESSYAQSTLWSTGEWRRHVTAGVAQAFDTRMPTVSFTLRLRDAVDQLSSATTRIALDNYEAGLALSAAPLSPVTEVVLALGPERGWSSSDRETLRAASFTLAHLGTRVLRTEAACVAALAVVKSLRGVF